jgi:hypothetical protein
MCVCFWNGANQSVIDNICVQIAIDILYIVACNIYIQQLVFVNDSNFQLQTFYCFIFRPFLWKCLIERGVVKYYY